MAYRQLGISRIQKTKDSILGKQLKRNLSWLRVINAYGNGLLKVWTKVVEGLVYWLKPNEKKLRWVGVYQKVDEEPTVVFCTTSSVMPKLEHIEQ